AGCGGAVRPCRRRGLPPRPSWRPCLEPLELLTPVSSRTIAAAAGRATSVPRQSPEDDRRCDGHPDCDPGTDEPRVAEETSDTCKGSARGEERQAAADQQRKRAACQQEQARPSTDKHARAMRVVALIAAHRLFL